MESSQPTHRLKLQWPTWLAIAFAALCVPVAQAQNLITQTPDITRTATDRGPASPESMANVTVHLKMQNQAAFDKAVEDLYTPDSPTYHRWLTDAQMSSYAPSSADLATVRKTLQDQGLQILSVSPDGSSIRARGTLGSMERVFQTQIHQFERAGQTFHANVTAAHLIGPADNLVAGVTGLSQLKMRSYLKQVVNPITGQTAQGVPVAQATNGFAGTLTNQCFGNPFAVTLNHIGYTYPVANYYGNAYTQGVPLCGWTPTQMQAHYGLTDAYKAGLDGSGETIVLVEGPTDETAMRNDFNMFNKLSGIAGASTSNLQVLYPDGQPSPLPGYYWQDESVLDLEWAHAIAPKAKIVVLIMPSQDWTEFEYAIQYAVDNKLGNVISNSYGLPEYQSGPYTINAFSQVIQQAAAKGIAVNFATGDGGDEGLGAPDAGGVSFPADSPFATAVGGTSLDVPSGVGNHAEVGWGNNEARLSASFLFVYDPPLIGGFIGGAGGGESTVFAKPSWQASVSGTNRQIPDISAVADPYTGGAVVLDGRITAIGGTSLACPVFSAIWALADQKAGQSLGQAAPLLATLLKKGAAITDIVPVSTPTNVAGLITDAAGTTYYSSDTLMAPVDTTTQYTTALWGPPFILGGLPGTFIDLSFGTDTSLQTATGWDNVTGWGIPNGVTFINAAAALK